MDKNPAMERKRKIPTGSHIGLEIMIKGAKKIRLRTATVIVMPERMRRMEPEMRRVKKPTSWVDLGA